MKLKQKNRGTITTEGIPHTVRKARTGRSFHAFIPCAWQEGTRSVRLVYVLVVLVAERPKGEREAPFRLLFDKAQSKTPSYSLSSKETFL